MGIEDISNILAIIGLIGIILGLFEAQHARSPKRKLHLLLIGCVGSVLIAIGDLFFDLPATFLFIGFFFIFLYRISKLREMKWIERLSQAGMLIFFSIALILFIFEGNSAFSFFLCVAMGVLVTITMWKVMWSEGRISKTMIGSLALYFYFSILVCVSLFISNHHTLSAYLAIFTSVTGFISSVPALINKLRRTT